MSLPDGRSVRALAYPPLVGDPVVGDAVLLNVGALDLGLGTGGYALVVALPDRLPPDREGPGHLVKARYTALQTVVLGADEQDAPTHALLADDTPLPEDWASFAEQPTDPWEVDPAEVAANRDAWLTEWRDVTTG